MPRGSEGQRREGARERRRAAALRRASTAERASQYLAFQDAFDPSSETQWDELLTDLVAIANSGGGIVLFVVRDEGALWQPDLAAIRALEPAQIAARLAAYTGARPPAVELADVEHEGKPAVAMLIEPAGDPLVAGGVVYVRHGASTQPATTADLAHIIERRRDDVRAALLDDLRRVIESPADAEVALLRRSAPGEAGATATIQITTDPGAPVYGKLSPDQTHPHRQKEVIAEVNRRLGGGQHVNGFNIQSIRAVHDLDEDTVPELVHLPKFGSRQYSDAFVDWVVKRVEADSAFLETTRERYIRRAR